MNTAGIVFLSLGILTIIIPIICAIVKHECFTVIYASLSFIFFLIFGMVNWPRPGKNDVKEGKAIYIEEKNVGVNQSGDTVYNYYTYHIEWLPEWKYGRKQ